MACRLCGAADPWVFYRAADVPVHSVLLFASRAAARAYPRGDVALALCAACGFIGNTAFEPEQLEYGGRYEETQAYSPTFNAFQERLVRRLIERFGLRGREIIEVGCGKGEFLARLCELGGNRGVGYDPSFDPDRQPASVGVTFVAAPFTAAEAGRGADAVCCKMTLEHIGDPTAFLQLLRAPLAQRSGGLLFLQVPNAVHLLETAAFWDVYYEHAAYYDAATLARLLARGGFRVVECWSDFDDQYLLCVATPDAAPATVAEASDLRPLAVAFGRDVPVRIAAWRERIARRADAGQRIVVWGAGSKAVAWLAALRLDDAIAYAVDVNPHKHGTFLPGSGVAVAAPARVGEEPPDTLVIMNRMYREEITADLAARGARPELLCLGEEER
jgi:2-polyprenyl-3-methyl-5-hydroxy-6-metoxy-1,4-benzoquinol methylase